MNTQTLLHHIQTHPGRDKIELAKHFSVTPFEISGPLSELLNEKLIFCKLSRGRAATYHPFGPEVAA